MCDVCMSVVIFYGGVWGCERGGFIYWLNEVFSYG